MRTYWEKRFACSMIGTRGFAMDLKEYLASGAGMEGLCSIVHMKDRDGNPRYEDFINEVMDSRLHIKEKNTKDYLGIQQQEEDPYSIWTLLADFAYGSAHNQKVGRYVPIEEIRQALRNGMGNRCDADQCIERYLEKEAADVFTQLMDKSMEATRDLREQYDILDYDDLINNKKGSTVIPDLKEAVGKSFRFYHKVTEEKRYQDLMGRSHEDKCIFLIKQNDRLLLRDRDWMNIFSNMERRPEAKGRRTC